MVHNREDFILRPLGFILDDEEPGDDDIVTSFWLHRHVFTCDRHKELIVPAPIATQTWRMKERMKTVSVALVLCLNIGVDPPDLVKVSPCARQQCWIDPQQFGDSCNDTSGQKPIEIIGAALQKQYERWQPRARYKLSLDPTVDDVKKLCTSLRRNAKDERVLFHYNGHGVPRPTPNGEIWVFNKHYTQYIPLSVCDLQVWMGSPSIYVFDCSNAGNVVEYLKNPPPLSLLKEIEGDADHVEHEVGEETSNKPETNACIMAPARCASGSFILLAACQSNETLPLNSGLPADLFTACLTTPIKTALKWYVQSKNSKLVPEFTSDLAERIPGQLNDRRTMLGELNWIFTAITDTIAWNVLSRELFQKLFRQDLLVASLFRNFLLAERILNYYNCSPISIPQLPPTRHHFMWMAWDYALDGVLKQLPNVLENPSLFKHSSFFSDQLTGFDMWLQNAISLKMNDDVWGHGTMAPPEQLPIVLQVLLSQVHRQRALELLGKFLNLGQWAASLALSVGIFPYVLKLLQSSAQELKSLLVFIWAKLLAVDNSCQADLVKDNGHKYFMEVLADASMEAETRMTAAFVVAMMVNDYHNGQVVAMTNNIISVCLLQVTDSHPGLRQWVVLCLSKVWLNYDEARWRGVRDSAHEKLFPLLRDPIPEVRAATVYCLGTFLSNTTDRDDQVIKIDNAVATSLLVTLYDGSPIVRKELVVALAGYVANFPSQFEKFASESLSQKSSYHTVTGQDAFALKGKRSKLARSNSASDLTANPFPDVVRLKNVSPITQSHGLRSTNVPSTVWSSLMILKTDPHPMVSRVASQLYDEITKVASKKPYGKEDRSIVHGRQDAIVLKQKKVAMALQSVQSNFFSWCCRKFSGPTLKVQDTDETMLRGEDQFTDDKPGSAGWYDRDLKYNRAARVIKSAEREQQKAKSSRLEELCMFKLSNPVGILKFHPFETHLAVIEEVMDETLVNIWDWEQNFKVSSISNKHTPHVKVTYMNFLNPQDYSLLLTGTVDGLVRVWKNYASSDLDAEMVTSWTALNNLIPMSNSPGLVMDWDEENQLLYASGNVEYIRIWDVNSEMKTRDIDLKANIYTTSLSIDPYNADVFVGGFTDGSVRIFDKRLPKDECEIKCLKQHTGRIRKVICPQGFENLLISASNRGDVILWDIRNGNDLKSIPPTCQQSELKAFDAHHRAEVIVCGHSGQLNLSAFKHNGDVASIKCHQGFMTQKYINTYLTFHPYKVKLAAANESNAVTVYGVKNPKKGDRNEE